MPELPEVETISRGLAKALTGLRISSVEKRAKGLRKPFPPDLKTRAEGRKIISITRRAKYILMSLSGNETIIFHLGMSGKLVLRQKREYSPNKHDHLVFNFSGKNSPALIFNDPRRFGLCDIVHDENSLLKSLGIEPLSPEFTAPALTELLKNKKTSIKSALLDQSIIAGLGNIYVCEALFYARISPKREARKCSPKELACLVKSIRKVLQSAIKAGGSSLRDYVRSDGTTGSFQNHFAVYGCEGKKCKTCTCNVIKTGGIKRITQGGRSSFYCETKQK
ncbi:MAG: bifunctional DNA-formamidopyrimidine glycosylase/DNA-(apurinic or apyrimidinic site) lyase [Alphaproteobacteria bacterium]|nr:bifunctional DNA-formamidopyrimidine glycosylase/DNA-(apurinic or apyrimidinic site) lyase [Alphaproteobacteria bacterium]